MKLARLLESESANHERWDRLVSAIDNLPNESPGPLIVDFVANAYNGGVAETLMFRDTDPISVQRALLSLARLSPPPNKVVELMDLLVQVRSEYQMAKDDYRAANPDGDEDDEDSQAYVYREFSENEQVLELEKWIYDDSNITPVFDWLLSVLGS